MVAGAIVEMAQRPQPEIVVGGSGKLMLVAQRLSPRVLDRYMTLGRRMIKQQQTDQPDDGQDNLLAPLPGPGSVQGGFSEQSKGSSPYTRQLEIHPNRKRVGLLLAALAAGAAVRKLGR